MNESQIIGDNIRKLREDRGLDIQWVANCLGITRQQFKKYEDGINRISANRLFKLKGIMECRWDDFFRGL